MADQQKKKEDEKVVIAEFKVSMYCNACERSVANALSKIKGVEKFFTDMPGQRVVVTGRMNPQKVMKKIKKKTGKRVQIVASKDGSKDSDEEEDSASDQETSRQILMESFGFECWLDNMDHTMFSDENPNACLIM